MARRDRAGLTLIELLLAMVIAVLLVAVVYSTYRTVHAVAAGQRDRLETRAAPADAVEQVRDDLMRLFDPGLPETRIVLTQRLEQAAVSFVAMVAPPGETDLRWAKPLRIEWSAAARDGRLDLVRAVQPVSGPGSQDAPASNIVVEDVGDFHVAFFDGTNWAGRWPPGASNTIPRAARLEVRSRKAPTNEAWKLDVWIPAGSSFTSTIQRLAR